MSQPQTSLRERISEGFEQTRKYLDEIQRHYRQTPIVDIIRAYKPQATPPLSDWDIYCYAAQSHNDMVEAFHAIPDTPTTEKALGTWIWDLQYSHYLDLIFKARTQLVEEGKPREAGALLLAFISECIKWEEKFKRITGGEKHG